MGRLLAGFAVIVALSIGLGAQAQDASTPQPAASPETLLCATPLAQAGNATPAETVAAPTTAASPGAVDPGTPIGLFPCGTPSGSPVSEATPTS